MKQNIDDIEQLAGASRATVSPVTDDRPAERAKTRHNVQEIIAGCNFHLDSAARMLAAKRAPIVGVTMGSPAQLCDPDSDSTRPTGPKGHNFSTHLAFRQFGDV